MGGLGKGLAQKSAIDRITHGKRDPTNEKDRWMDCARANYCCTFCRAVVAACRPGAPEQRHVLGEELPPAPQSVPLGLAGRGGGAELVRCGRRKTKG